MTTPADTTAAPGTHPQPDPRDPQEFLLQFFTYAHLPQHLQDVSAMFAHLASILVSTLPRNPERTTCLRKLLEAKDCFVRAAIDA